MLAADAQHLAGDQHDLATEHIVGGHAVFQAVHAAGVLRDVAADGAGDLRGRIGRVIKAFMGDRVRDRQIGDAGLDHGDAVGEVDLLDPVELGHAQQHPVGQRQRAAGERGAGPARHHPDALVVAIAQHFRNLGGGLRQHHHHGQLAVGRQPVALIRAHFAFAGDHPLARDDVAQGGNDTVASGHHRAVQFRHPHRHASSLPRFSQTTISAI